MLCEENYSVIRLKQPYILFAGVCSQLSDDYDEGINDRLDELDDAPARDSQEAAVLKFRQFLTRTICTDSCNVLQGAVCTCLEMEDGKHHQRMCNDPLPHVKLLLPVHINMILLSGIARTCPPLERVVALLVSNLGLPTNPDGHTFGCQRERNTDMSYLGGAVFPCRGAASIILGSTLRL
jgi:hypothetical protein